MRRCAAALRTTRHIRRPYLPSPIALSAAAPSGCAPSVQSPRARPERSASPPALVRLPVGLPSRSQRQAPSTQRHARPTHHHHPQPLETHTTAHLSSAACAREALNAPAHAHPRALGATMISCLLLLNAKGDVILQRHYRHDVPKTAIDAFRTKVIGAKESMSKPPVMLYEGCSFLCVWPFTPPTLPHTLTPPPHPHQLRPPPKHVRGHGTKGQRQCRVGV